MIKPRSDKGRKRKPYHLQIAREDMLKYGERFKFIRTKMGLNTSEMSEIIGVFRTTIAKWEKGISIPQTDIEYILRRYEFIYRKFLENSKVN